MRKLILLLFLPALHGADPAPCKNPEECWNLLMSGNRDWVAGRLQHPNQSKARREAVADHQTPFAVVLSCSDSRVLPEVVFDRGVGDLFVIRVAGNVVDQFAIGSIQYAVEVQKYTRLIVVLGHQRCGAVEAAVKNIPLPEPLASLVKSLHNAVEISRSWPGDHVENAIDANVHLVSDQLSKMFMKDGAVVLGKRYSLDTGAITDPRWIP
jgi:carbonic anhydrase